MAEVNIEKAVEKKLHLLNNTQDSIQGLSLWILHRKDEGEKIVKTWAKVVQKAKTSHRLTLFYLCNDVVQNCRRKNAKIYLLLFKTVLKDVVPLARHESVRPSIKRILKIWDERKVFPEEFVMELHELLVTEEERQLKQQQEVDAKLLAEFKPQIVVDTLRSFRRFETELDGKLRQITSFRVDATISDAIKRLKDRKQGADFNHQFEDAENKLQDYILGVERVVKEREALIDLLAMTEHFFELQYGEAKVVANAYKNFGTRVNKQRKHLEEVKRTLPEVMSPLPSPTMDAPSPTGSNTPPDLAVPSNFNNQVVDMELDEEATSEQILTGGPLRTAHTTTVNTYHFPIPSVKAITMGDQESKKKDEEAYSPRSEESAPSPEGSPIDLQLSPDTTKEDMDIVKGASHVPQYSPRGAGAVNEEPSPSKSFEAVYNPRVHLDPRQTKSMDFNIMNDDVYVPSLVTSTLPALAQIQQIDSSGDSTPVKDEGDTTPTQDEFPDSSQSNPVDFLTRLINQSKKSSELSPGLLQNLSMLRETVKKQATVAKLMEDSTDFSEKSQSPTPSGPSSWAAWKAQKQAATQPDSSAESTPVRELEPVPPAKPIHNGRKSLDERLQEQMQDVVKNTQIAPPQAPVDNYMPDHFSQNLVESQPVHNEARRRLSQIMPVQTVPVQDHVPRLSFSPPPDVEQEVPQQISPPTEQEDTRSPIVIRFNQQPKRGILKMSNPANITVCTVGDDQGPQTPNTIITPESPGLSIPTIGGLKRAMRPPFPPRSGSMGTSNQTPARPSIPPPPPTQKQSEVGGEIENEFINKLKQKTVNSAPPVPAQRQNSNSNLRTVITVDASLSRPPPPPPPPPPVEQNQYPPPQQYEAPPTYNQHPPYEQTFSEPPPAFEPKESPPVFNPQRPPPPFDPSRPPPNFSKPPPPHDVGPGILKSPRGPPPRDNAPLPSTPETPPSEPLPYSPEHIAARLNALGRSEHHHGDTGERFPKERQDSVGHAPAHPPPFDKEHPPFDREHPPFDRERPPFNRERPPFDRERPPFDRERGPFDRDSDRPPFPLPPRGWFPPPPDHFDRFRDPFGPPPPKRPFPPPPRHGMGHFGPRRF